MSKVDKFAQEFSSEYRKVKIDKIAGTIKRYIDSKKTENHNFVKFLSYILRCKPDDSYMYVGDTGRSIYIVPSVTELTKLNISLEIEEKPNRSDYASMIKVYVDGHVRFEFELNFRWTKSQWVGDLNQVGKHLKVHL